MFHYRVKVNTSILKQFLILSFGWQQFIELEVIEKPFWAGAQALRAPARVEVFSLEARIGANVDLSIVIG